MRALDVPDVGLLVIAFLVVLPVVCAIELARDARARRRDLRVIRDLPETPGGAS